MPTHQSTEICILGAGVVGLATAWHLLNRGHEVTIIDPLEPGQGASLGNAGTLAATTGRLIADRLAGCQADRFERR